MLSPRVRPRIPVELHDRGRLYGGEHPVQASDLRHLSLNVGSATKAGEGAPAAAVTMFIIVWSIFASRAWRRRDEAVRRAEPEQMAQRQQKDALPASDRPVSVEGYPLEEIAVPTLIIHSADDTLAHYETAPRGAARIPGARFVTIDRGGHIFVGREARVREEIGGFIRSHAAEEGASSEAVVASGGRLG
jgi:pimeloyl-ACP methyl ester carboxylesterase